MDGEKTPQRRDVLKAVGGTVAGMAAVGSLSTTAAASDRSNEQITLTANVDDLEFVTDASLTIEERGDSWFVRESMSVETPKDAPVQQYNLRLESEHIDTHGDQAAPSVSELARDASTVVDSRTLDVNTAEFVAQRRGVSAHDVGTMSTWSGVELVTASQYCGDLAATELEVNWEHHGTNPMTQYSEYHGRSASPWTVNGAECSFPDFGFFETTWHTDNFSHDGGNTGGGEVEAYAEGSYYNTDFPMPYAGTHYAHHEVEIFVATNGGVAYEWDREHEGTYSSVLDPVPVTTW